MFNVWLKGVFLGDIVVEIKKAIFVNPFPYYAEGINEATIYPPLGIAYLASVVEA